MGLNSQVPGKQGCSKRSGPFCCDPGAAARRADSHRFMATAEWHHGYTSGSIHDAHRGVTAPELGLHAGGRFWLAIVFTGLATGACAAALTLILQAVQHFVWPGTTATFLDAAAQATPWRRQIPRLSI